MGGPTEKRAGGLQSAVRGETVIEGGRRQPGCLGRDTWPAKVKMQKVVKPHKGESAYRSKLGRPLGGHLWRGERKIHDANPCLGVAEGLLRIGHSSAKCMEMPLKDIVIEAATTR